MFTSPSTVSAADPHRCSTQQEASYARISLVQMPSRWNATIFIACNSLSESHMPSKMSIFQLFDSKSYGHAHYPSTTAHSFDILRRMFAHHGPFDAPEPLCTSVSRGCCCLHRCRRILRRCLAELGILRLELANTALCDGMDVAIR